MSFIVVIVTVILTTLFLNLFSAQPVQSIPKRHFEMPHFDDVDTFTDKQMQRLIDAVEDAHAEIATLNQKMNTLDVRVRGVEEDVKDIKHGMSYLFGTLVTNFLGMILSVVNLAYELMTFKTLIYIMIGVPFTLWAMTGLVKLAVWYLKAQRLMKARKTVQDATN